MYRSGLFVARQILYKGSGCRTVKPTRGKWCVTPFSGFRSSGYHPDLNFTTCAVVGNSDSLKRQEWGEEINAHSVVIRFNEAPTVGFKKYAGDWHPGTIRIQNKERGGFAERSGEKCLVWPNNVYQRRRSNKRCQVTRMKSSFANYGKKYWKDHSPPGGSPSSGNKAKVSNGFLGVLLALHKCAQVDIYGFSQGRGHYFKKFTGRAKGWGNPNKPIVMNSRPHNRRHSWTAERACIKRLNDEISEVRSRRREHGTLRIVFSVFHSFFALCSLLTKLFVSLSLCLCLSVCLSVCLSLSLSLSVFVFVFALEQFKVH